MIFAVAVFVLGSGIAGGAASTAMLIGTPLLRDLLWAILKSSAAGRALQGIGGAGVSVFGNVIVSDLTTVRERSKYMAIVFASLGVGLALGPPLGGIMAEHDWRWVFVSAIMLAIIAKSGTLSGLTYTGGPIHPVFRALLRGTFC